MRIRYNREEVAALLSVFAQEHTRQINPALKNTHWELTSMSDRGATLVLVEDDDNQSGLQKAHQKISDMRPTDAG